MTKMIMEEEKTKRLAEASALENYRLAHHLTNEQMAREMGISPSLYSKIKGGKISAGRHANILSSRESAGERYLTLMQESARRWFSWTTDNRIDQLTPAAEAYQKIIELVKECKSITNPTQTK